MSARCTLCLLAALGGLTHDALQDEPSPRAFEAPKFGLAVDLPDGWELAARERDDLVFLAKVPSGDDERPGAAACELALAPESLDVYRDGIARNQRLREARGVGGTLLRNEVVETPRGPQLEVLRRYEPAGGPPWKERVVHRVAHRQLYSFTLNVPEDRFDRESAALDALLDAARFEPPNTGADRVAGSANRWAQREFRFAIDLPEGWQPALAPAEVALLFACDAPHGSWSDNLVVVAHGHRATDLRALARVFPDELRAAEPGCEVLSCRVVPQGDTEALETVVRTRRGPFTMTVLERRFAGERFDYEVKYTVESARFDDQAPTLRRSLDSFGELPGTTPGPGPSRPA